MKNCLKKILIFSTLILSAAVFPLTALAWSNTPPGTNAHLYQTDVSYHWNQNIQYYYFISQDAVTSVSSLTVFTDQLVSSGMECPAGHDVKFPDMEITDTTTGHSLALSTGQSTYDLSCEKSVYSGDVWQYTVNFDPSAAAVIAFGSIAIGDHMRLYVASTYGGSTYPYGLDANTPAYIINSAPPALSVSITQPTNSSTIEDFNDNFWQVTMTAPELTGGDMYELYVDYGTSDTYPYLDAHAEFNCSGGCSSTVFNINKNNILTSGTWYAEAFVDLHHESEHTSLVSSDKISFNINFPTLPGGTAAPPAPPTVTCGDTDYVCKLQQWFSTELQAILNYLFIPSGNSLNQWTTLWNPIKTKPPIGYITSVIAAFGAISTSGTPTFTLASLSELSNLTTPIDTFIGSILWFFIALWLLRRIAKMEL
jgi:hypothetical protein